MSRCGLLRSLAPLGGVPVSKTDIMSSGSRGGAAAAEEAKRERGSFQCAITIITACKYNTTDPTLTDGDSHSCLIAQDGPEGRTRTEDAVKVAGRAGRRMALQSSAVLKGRADSSRGSDGHILPELPAFSMCAALNAASAARELVRVVEVRACVCAVTYN